MEEPRLHHCTDFESFCGILQSRHFRPRPPGLDGQHHQWRLREVLRRYVYIRQFGIILEQS